MEHYPRGTVAFLFTDLEGSTRLWEAHAEAMRAAYARHDAVLRTAVAAYGGVVYKVIGDALQAAFPSAAEAVGAARTRNAVCAPSRGRRSGCRVRCGCGWRCTPGRSIRMRTATTGVRC